MFAGVLCSRELLGGVRRSDVQGPAWPSLLPVRFLATIPGLAVANGGMRGMGSASDRDPAPRQGNAHLMRFARAGSGPRQAVSHMSRNRCQSR